MFCRYSAREVTETTHGLRNHAVSANVVSNRLFQHANKHLADAKQRPLRHSTSPQQALPGGSSGVPARGLRRMVLRRGRGGDGQEEGQDRMVAVPGDGEQARLLRAVHAHVHAGNRAAGGVRTATTTETRGLVTTDELGPDVLPPGGGHAAVLRDYAEDVRAAGLPPAAGGGRQTQRQRYCRQPEGNGHQEGHVFHRPDVRAVHRFARLLRALPCSLREVEQGRGRAEEVHREGLGENRQQNGIKRR